MKILVALMFVGACWANNAPPPASPPPPAPPARALRAPVKCGAATCGPDEYCENKCLCCGMPVDPSQLKGESTCKPLPASCRGVKSPECDQRTVDVPCA